MAKKYWKEAIKYDLKFIRLTENMDQDNSLWRSRINVIDHKYRAPGHFFGFDWIVIIVMSVSYTHLTLPTNREV